MRAVHAKNPQTCVRSARAQRVCSRHDDATCPRVSMLADCVGMNSRLRTISSSAARLCHSRCVALLALFALATQGCPSGTTNDGGPDARGGDDGVRHDGDAEPPRCNQRHRCQRRIDGPDCRLPFWQSQVQPVIAAQCAPCHVGQRFAFASLQRAGAAFTAEETAVNYEHFVDLISIDVPAEQSVARPAAPDRSRPCDATCRWTPTGGQRCDVQHAAHVDPPGEGRP